MKSIQARQTSSLLLILALFTAIIPSQAQAENQVGIVDFMRFEPQEIKIKAGQSVTWVNRDGSNHKIKFSDSTSPRLRHDASYSKRFDSPGNYDYVCDIHGKKMSGRVLVTAP